ncbi:tetratricopeptide repeat protein [Candidatus Gracilibacteria bacterium]|jgi:tetratricopeptide (TPR) repeat protein|nr:tetratricopeptide repeat protein [Candidatus Gracilibacteria bacterium]
MNKFLATLWVIIIAGLIVISVGLLSPKEAGDITLTDTEKTTQENITPIVPLPEVDENSASSLTRLGDKYLKEHKPKEAQETYQKAEKLDPSSTTIKLKIAQSFLDQRNLDAAKSLIWSLNKEDPEVQYYTGIILTLFKDPEGAKKTFTEIATRENDPNKANAQYFLNAFTTFSYYKEGEYIFLETLLGKAMTEAKQYEAAIPLLYDVINQKNNYRDAWIVLGYAYLNTGKYQDATDALIQALKLDNEKPETLFFLGVSYSFIKDTDKAIFYLEKAKSYGFTPAEEIEIRLGDLYTIEGEYKKSAMLYEKVLTSDTKNISLYTKAIWVNIEKLKDTNKALLLAKKALQESPSDAASFNLVGWALSSKGNTQSAKSYLSKAIELNPKLEAAYLNLGQIYEQESKIALAKDYYTKAYSLGQGNSISKLAEQRYQAILKN